MRRLATVVLVTAIFVLSVVAGIAAYRWLGSETRREVAQMTTDTRDAAPPAPVLAPTLSSPPVAARAPLATHEPAAPNVTTRRHRPPPARDLSRKDVRGLVEHVFKGNLGDRELTPHDYDRLVAAVMRLRKAARRFHSAYESHPDAAALEEQRQAMISALGEIERITGVPPSNVGDLLGSDADPSGKANDAASPE